MFFYSKFVVYMLNYIYCFSYTEPSLHLWDEAYFIMVDDHFDVFLELVCMYFTEYFYIYVHEGNWFVILFAGSLCGLGIRVTVAS